MLITSMPVILAIIPVKSFIWPSFLAATTGMFSASGRLAAAATNTHIIDLILQQRNRVVWLLKVRDQVSRSATDEASNAGIFHNRLIKVDDHRVNKRQNPAVILTRIFAR